MKVVVILGILILACGVLVINLATTPPSSYLGLTIAAGGLFILTAGIFTWLVT